MSEDSNPYRSGTPEYSDWVAGFDDFFQECRATDLEE